MAKARRPAPKGNRAQERRRDARRPIRLKVAYKSARSLVTEYTTSVSKGGCQLHTKRKLAVGTRFVFEMFATGATVPVEIEGQVVRSVRGSDGLYEVGIRYLASDEKREALQDAITQMLEEHRFEKARRHPRIPVNLIAHDATDPARRYLLRDLSQGGIGLRMPNFESVPEGMAPGRRVQLQVRLAGSQPVLLGAQVVWRTEGRAGFTMAGVGLSFTLLGARQLEVLEALLKLARPESLQLSIEPAATAQGAPG